MCLSFFEQGSQRIRVWQLRSHWLRRCEQDGRYSVWPISQSRSGLPSMASETAMAWASVNEAT